MIKESTKRTVGEARVTRKRPSRSERIHRRRVLALKSPRGKGSGCDSTRISGRTSQLPRARDLRTESTSSSPLPADCSI